MDFCSNAHFNCQNSKINGPKIVSLIYIVFNYARGKLSGARLGTTRDFLRALWAFTSSSVPPPPLQKWKTLMTVGNQNFKIRLSEQITKLAYYFPWNSRFGCSRVRKIKLQSKNIHTEYLTWDLDFLQGQTLDSRWRKPIMEMNSKRKVQ